MADSNEFQVVRRKGKKKGNGKAQIPPSPSVGLEKSGPSPFNRTLFEKRLKDCIQELKISDFYLDCEDLLRNVICSMVDDLVTDTETVNRTQCVVSDASPHPSLVSYGIGSFSTCPIARYQLAFLMLLQEKNCSQPCMVYDPIFSGEEKTMLEHLGCNLISHNEEGKRVCGSPTILFMPHCGKALYNNLIWANLATLSNLVIVGNSFSRMLESTPHRHLTKTAKYVIKVTPYMTETPLKSSSFVHSDVFNDLAVHVFPRSKLVTAPVEFWESNVEPEYNSADVEIIRGVPHQDNS